MLLTPEGVDPVGDYIASLALSLKRSKDRVRQRVRYHLNREEILAHRREARRLERQEKLRLLCERKERVRALRVPVKKASASSIDEIAARAAEWKPR